MAAQDSNVLTEGTGHLSSRPSPEDPQYTLLQTRVPTFQAYLSIGDFAAQAKLLPAPPQQVLVDALPSLLLEIYDSFKKKSDDGHVFAAKEAKEFLLTFDSGSDTHLFTLEAAEALFTTKQLSTLRVVGVSGKSTNADLSGHLIVCVEDPLSGYRYNIDLGQAHAMQDCPMNLLSVSLLLQVGASVHFEKDNCWFKVHDGAEPIKFVQRDGLFHVAATKAQQTEPRTTTHSYVLHGQVYRTAGDLRLWHRRCRHLDFDKLMQINRHNLVDGFKLNGRQSASCGCDTCRMTKIRRVPIHKSKEFADSASFVGHTVSTDTKSLPYVSMQGFRYVLVFVDHYSDLSIAFFMRSKTESAAKLRLYLAEMARLGVARIANIVCDRGSEFFEQSGDTMFDKDRNLHAFHQVCEENRPARINLIVQPVESKAKRAELFFREHFKVADAYLWEARLGPWAWADALSYSTHQFNRTPQDRFGGLSPWSVVTGERARWDNFRVFGADVYEFIPNDKLAKVPGIPKGRKVIFVGFDVGASGFRVFDPETRRYYSTKNAYFYEDFSHRVDALRHHDRRRAMLKKGKPGESVDMPLVLDDFEDTNSSAVRSLYLDPDAPAPSLAEQDAASPSVQSTLEASGSTGVKRGGATPINPDTHSMGPLPGQSSQRAVAGSGGGAAPFAKPP